VAARGARAAADPRNRISRRRIASGICEKHASVSPRLERSRLCRGPQCSGRIPLGGRAIRAITALGGRVGQSSGDFDLCDRQRSSGTGRKGGERDDSDRFLVGGRPDRVWACREPKPTGRKSHGRDLPDHGARAETAGAAARAGADGKQRGIARQPDDPNAESQARDQQAAARALGLQLHILRASTEGDIETNLAGLAQLRTSILVIGADPLFTSLGRQLAALTVRHALPAIQGTREFAAGGGLVSYGADPIEPYRTAGVYVGRILKGEKPADLPVQRSTKVELIVNLKTAQALGLTVPLTLLGRADEVIE